MKLSPYWVVLVLLLMLSVTRTPLIANEEEVNPVYAKALVRTILKYKGTRIPETAILKLARRFDESMAQVMDDGGQSGGEEIDVTVGGGGGGPGGGGGSGGPTKCHPRDPDCER